MSLTPTTRLSGKWRVIPETLPSHDVEVVVAGATVVTATSAGIIPDATVLVANGVITYVGPADAAPHHQAVEHIDGRGKVIFPGLVNTHTHASQALVRATRAPRTLSDWITDVALPAARQLTPDLYEIATLLAGVEALCSGTTDLIDYTLDHDGTDMYRAALRAASRLGITLHLARGLSGHGRPGLARRPIREKLAELDELRSASGSPVHVALPPVAGLSDPDLEVIAEWRRERDIFLTAHLAEDDTDDAECEQRYGCTVAERLDRSGLLSPRTLAVHCTRLTPADADRLAASGATISHNPVSNLYLRSGQAPISEFLRRGIRVTLGTDGAASNGKQDLLEAMKTRALAADAPDEVSAAAEQAFRQATISGREFIAPDAVSGLTSGASADFFLFDPSRLWSTLPARDPVSTLVYSGSPQGVETVVVRGRVIVRDGRVVTIDEVELRVAAARAAAEVMA